jgi:hypothetical protein
VKAKLAGIALFLAALAPAATLFNQTPPTDNAFDMTFFRVADDFVLGQASSIKGIAFWYQAQEIGDLSSVAYAFYQDAGGALGTLITSGVATPNTASDVNAFLASFSIPTLVLGTGTYWLELHNGSSLTDTSGFAVDWSNAADNGTNHLLFSSTPDSPLTHENVSGFEQLAFQLSGDIVNVPEPATALLIGVGLVAIWWGRSARRKRIVFKKSSGSALKNQM